MRAFTQLTTALLVGAVLARSGQHVNKRVPENRQQKAAAQAAQRLAPRQSPPSYGGDGSHTGPIIPQNANTTKYKVDGSAGAIPFVNFDIGESYAGLMPISDEDDASELYFWFFPSHNPQAEDEILIWLNGGPGCSSLEGLLQENGVFLWQYGTHRPVENQYTWVNLTNVRISFPMPDLLKPLADSVVYRSQVVWVEQPAGTGFSKKRGTPAATNEVEVADQFLGFWKNFIDTFSLHNRKVFISGESYAGYYVPYIASAMHNASDTTYYGVDSILFYDPSTSYDVVQQQIPAVPFVDYWKPLFNFNDTYMEELHQRADECGYTEFMEKAMTFPPDGLLPTPPQVDTSAKCDVWDDIITAAMAVNPCWDVYAVQTTCPLLWDVLGFPGSFEYDGPWIYFNRTDVQKAINAPVGDWAECSGGVLDKDTSPPSGLSVLPSVIEKNKRTVIAHGQLDFILLTNGTIMMIQNMTWGGKQGFSTPPGEWNDFYVPYHSEENLGSLAGAGIFGQWWEERGLTFTTVDLSGHMVPQYQPSSAYRQLEYLLGRIDSLSEVSDFTTQKGDFGNDGNATMRMM